MLQQTKYNNRLANIHKSLTKVINLCFFTHTVNFHQKYLYINDMSKLNFLLTKYKHRLTKYITTS